MSTIDDLIAWTAWATGRVLDHVATLPESALDAEFDIGHRTIRATVSHMTDAIVFWTGTISGIPGSESPGPGDLSTMRVRRDAAWDAFTALATATIGDGSLDRHFLHDGNPTSAHIAITHVTLHDHLHRSELLHMLQRLGVNGLWDDDLVEWSWNC